MIFHHKSAHSNKYLRLSNVSSMDPNLHTDYLSAAKVVGRESSENLRYLVSDETQSVFACSLARFQRFGSLS